MAHRSEFATLCATDKSRKKLLARINELAGSLGATVKLHEFNGPREIGLTIKLGPYRCMVEFEGGSHVGAFLGHWHTEMASSVKYPRNFASTIQGSLNEYHFGKATSCEDTFDGFLRSLSNGFAALAKEQQQAA
jgi:hypothetical protein